MFNGSVDEKIYIDCMTSQKRLVQEYHKIHNGQTYLAGRQQEKLKALFQNGVSGLLKGSLGYIKNKAHMKKLYSIVKPLKRDRIELPAPNYFSGERIAVYTCVFGNYDAVREPFCHPNNIDYYIITDQPVSADSAWKPIDLSPYLGLLAQKTNVEKNRWFKMHPHEIFPDYNYSIYIDGNVVPVTDFTELVNRMGEPGIAMFWHSYNNCVYQEAYYNRYSVKKISNEELEKHIAYLRQQKMPEDFGMTTCNVIVRDHRSELCRKLMDDWWHEFITHCRRDMISFPYVVWKNGLNMCDIATLGYDVWNSDSLIVNEH